MILVKTIKAVNIDKHKCTSCCGCELRCPEVFSVGDFLVSPEQSKARLLPNAVDFFISHAERVELAARQCVAQAITIEYEE